jgi:hypothetical protein
LRAYILAGSPAAALGTVPMAFRPAQPAHVSDSGVMALVLEPAGDVETGEVADAEA